MEITVPVNNTNNYIQPIAETIGTVSHSDIRSLEGDKLINRTKNDISPFVEIRKTPSFTQGGNLTNYGIEYVDDDKWKLAGSVSPNYLLVENREIDRLAQDILDMSGMDYELNRMFWDGGRFAAIYDLLDGPREAVHDGVRERDIGLSLVVRNSYNGTWKAEASLMTLDFFCMNGMLSGKFFSSVSFKHTQNNNEWAELVKQGMGVLDTSQTDLQKFATTLQVLGDKVATSDHMTRLFGKKGVLRGLGPQMTGKVINRFYEGESRSLYGILDAGTQVMWHQKQSFSAASFKNNRDFVDAMSAYAGIIQN